MQRDPLQSAANLWRSLPRHRDELRLLGGLAARAHLGQIARQTADVDLAVLSGEALAALTTELRDRGFHVGQSGGWHRAVRGQAGDREVVDISPHPVVNPKTFETVALRGPPKPVVIHGEKCLAVALVDLVVLKLTAGRDQDIVDLMLLVGHETPSAAEVVHHIELDDAERSAAATMLEARHAVEHSYLDDVTVDLLGRHPTPDERSKLLDFLSALQKEGL